MAHGNQSVQERARWQGASGLERLDAVGARQYAIADQTAGSLQLVDDATGLVRSMTTPRGPLNGGPARFRRLGILRVAGVSCTEWEVTPPAPGAEVDQICLTDDGVLLNIRIGAVQRARAASVRYAPLDVALFAAPASYRRIQMPVSITPPAARP